eukprot:TRINITY_DN6933_c0_g1::TRINITY_DN6933_c0_g1_i1::g.13328::m.13328 TRINITY_DN6933_c0_g1::TRINITY_DN6933_c0_g1_i1::g.13328  ORF type:complete len:146 (+),score=7.12,sp/Q9Y2G8/DJC16_HUMAN/50.00/1e-10,DnaJ/PF00226.26/2.5e-14,DUF4460/PF14687.1/0.03,SURF2/PF05477.6/0.1 TRINITY_DN6933_c0_g1_i1:145-582(+)
MAPHRVLGIRRTASKEEVKEAFRKFCLLWHPDMNKSPEAAQKFVQGQKAYKHLVEALETQEKLVGTRATNLGSSMPPGTHTKWTNQQLLGFLFAVAGVSGIFFFNSIYSRRNVDRPKWAQSLSDDQWKEIKHNEFYQPVDWKKTI